MLLVLNNDNTVDRRRPRQHRAKILTFLFTIHGQTDQPYEVANVFYLF